MKKSKNTDTGCNMEELWKQDAKIKKGWKVTYCVIPFMQDVQNRQICRDRK